MTNAETTYTRRYVDYDALHKKISELNLDEEVRYFISCVYFSEHTYVYPNGMVGLGMAWENFFCVLARLMGHSNVTLQTFVDKIDSLPDVDNVFQTFFAE